MSKIDEVLYFEGDLDRRQIKTKKAIITTFLNLMSKKDISKITITELAKEANIDRKTFYLHYDSIEGVYEELGNKIFNIVNNMINEYMESDIKFSPYYLFLTVNEMLNDKLDFFKNAVNCTAFSVFVDKIKTAFYDALIKAYAQPGKELNERFRLTIEFISSGTVSMYVRWLKGSIDTTMDELAKLSGDIIIHGISGVANRIM